MWVDARDLLPRQSECTGMDNGLGNKQADFGLCFRVQELPRRLALMLLMRLGLYTTGCVLSAAGLDF